MCTNICNTNTCITDDDEGNGDPHFIVTSHDQYHTKLCYDVNGNDGDVLLVIRDEDTSEYPVMLY